MAELTDKQKADSQAVLDANITKTPSPDAKGEYTQEKEKKPVTGEVVVLHTYSGPHGKGYEKRMYVRDGDDLNLYVDHFGGNRSRNRADEEKWEFYQGYYKSGEIV